MAEGHPLLHPPLPIRAPLPWAATRRLVHLLQTGHPVAPAHTHTTQQCTALHQWASSPITARMGNQNTTPGRGATGAAEKGTHQTHITPQSNRPCKAMTATACLADANGGMPAPCLHMDQHGCMPPLISPASKPYPCQSRERAEAGPGYPQSARWEGSEAISHASQTSANPVMC